MTSMRKVESIVTPMPSAPPGESPLEDADVLFLHPRDHLSDALDGLLVEQALEVEERRLLAPEEAENDFGEALSRPLRGPELVVGRVLKGNCLRTHVSVYVHLCYFNPTEPFAGTTRPLAPFYLRPPIARPWRRRSASDGAGGARSSGPSSPRCSRSAWRRRTSRTRPCSTSAPGRGGSRCTSRRARGGAAASTRTRTRWRSPADALARRGFRTRRSCRRTRTPRTTASWSGARSTS